MQPRQNGVPQAKELAAARIKLFPPSATRARLIAGTEETSSSSGPIMKKMAARNWKITVD